MLGDNTKLRERWGGGGRERERERERESDRQTDRQTDRQKEGEREGRRERKRGYGEMLCITTAIALQ